MKEGNKNETLDDDEDRPQAGSLIDRTRAGSLIDRTRAGSLIDRTRAGSLIDRPRSGSLMRRSLKAGIFFQRERNKFPKDFVPLHAVFEKVTPR